MLDAAVAAGVAHIAGAGAGRVALLAGAMLLLQFAIGLVNDSSTPPRRGRTAGQAGGPGPGRAPGPRPDRGRIVRRRPVAGGGWPGPWRSLGAARAWQPAWPTTSGSSGPLVLRSRCGRDPAAAALRVGGRDGIACRRPSWCWCRWRPPPARRSRWPTPSPTWGRCRRCRAGRSRQPGDRRARGSGRSCRSWWSRARWRSARRRRAAQGRAPARRGTRSSRPGSRRGGAGPAARAPRLGDAGPRPRRRMRRLGWIAGAGRRRPPAG